MFISCAVNNWASIPLTAKMSSNNNKVIIVAIWAILSVLAHTLFIKCIHLAALGHVKSAGRGAYVHAAKNFFYKGLWSVSLCVLSEGGLQCNASVSGLSLLGGLHWPSIRQSLCVSQSSVTACGLPKDSALSLISASPSSAEAPESRSKHDCLYRVGSRRRLVLETACSDPPTDAQRNCNTHALSCTNFATIVGMGQLVVMVAHGWTWLIARILGCSLWNQKWKRYMEIL